MKHTWKAALIVAALFSTTQIAKADLTVNGATGLILNPTAQLVQKGQPQIQANYYDFGTAWNDKFYGVYGAIRAADKLEVSGGLNKYKSEYESWERSGFAIGAKYQLLSEAEKGFGLAVGAGYDRALQRNTHAYVAATKTLGSPVGRAAISGTVGVRWDRFTEGDGFKSSKASVYAGAQVPLSRNGEVSLIGEIQSKNLSTSYSALGDPKFPYAVGLRYQPAGQAFSLTAGLQRHGLTTPDSSSSKLFVQAGYTFGR